MPSMPFFFFTDFTEPVSSGRLPRGDPGGRVRDVGADREGSNWG